MTKNHGEIYSFSIENIIQKISDLEKLGYSKKRIIIMTKKNPAIFSFSIISIRKKIEDLIALGFSPEEVLEMTSVYPALFGYTIENMKQKIDDIVSLGFSLEEVMHMAKDFPSIFGLSIDNIREKVEFYRQIGLPELPLMDPSLLMQSVALSYARFMFFQEKGIMISYDNKKRLFMAGSEFEKRYGISKVELLDMYTYDDFGTPDDPGFTRKRIND